MADLTITVTDAQETRIKAALGQSVTPDATEETPNPTAVWTPATDAQVDAAILANLKRQVEVYEKNSATRTAIASVSTALTAEGW
jgi:hypothetical protein